MDRTDAELLIASRDDAHAFRELYDRWADRLLAYFYRRTLDAEVAGDLLAETFAVAFERRRRFRDIGAPGANWLYGIAAKESSSAPSGGWRSSCPRSTTTRSPASRRWPTWRRTGRPSPRRWRTSREPDHRRRRRQGQRSRAGGGDLGLGVY